MESDVALREAELSLREEKSNLELDYKRKQADLERNQERLTELEAELNTKESELEKETKSLDEVQHEAERTRRLYQLKLHQISQMDQEEARQLLIRVTEKECEKEIRDLRHKLLDRSESELAEESRRILLASMQRITSQPMNDATATVVRLPSEEMKGRIIGREGRNIRTFEHATGTTLMIDETPDSVLISCFDPVRREIARLALEALLRDGRIHPASIEEEVIKAEEEMHLNVIELGEGALRKLRLVNVHPEVVALLGKLHYRLSNNQNTLAHSVEVGHLCALIASEIGMDPVLAKRAGLFHDMGKAVDESYEGSHAIVGADIIKQHGEDARVVNAVAAHHKEVPAESVYAGLVMVADSLSAVRPGARASSIDGFIQRVRSIEDIAQSQPGVSDAYAIQAGREVRVIVEPEKVSEEEARKIALRIRQKIESELNYPGAIEITVIREQRFNETAV
jgi:ribonuclease Y